MLTAMPTRSRWPQEKSPSKIWAVMLDWNPTKPVPITSRQVATTTAPTRPNTDRASNEWVWPVRVPR